MKRRIFSVICSLLMAAGVLPAQNGRFNRRVDAYADLRAGGCEITETSLDIEGSMGEMMGFLYTPDNVEKPPVVICSHGYGGAFTLTQPAAKYFASQGFAAYCYSFCGGGPNNGSAGSMVDMSVLTEAVDLNKVIDYFKKAGYGKIFLYGESQGGFVSTYVAGERPQDIAGMLLIYPAYVIRDDCKLRENPDGSFPKTSDVMGRTIGEKYDIDAMSFDIYDMMKKYPGQVMIIHGDNDRIVPLKYSLRALDTFPNAELLVLPREGHGFTPDGIRKAAVLEVPFLRSCR